MVLVNYNKIVKQKLNGPKESVIVTSILCYNLRSMAKNAARLLWIYLTFELQMCTNILIVKKKTDKQHFRSGLSNCTLAFCKEK